MVLTGVSGRHNLCCGTTTGFLGITKVAVGVGAYCANQKISGIFGATPGTAYSKPSDR